MQVTVAVLSVYLCADGKERGSRASGLKKSKEDKGGDWGSKTAEDQKEGRGGTESLEMVEKCCPFHLHWHASLIFLSSWCFFFLSGGRKRSMNMEWNGSSWNTMDPTSPLSTSHFLAILTSTIMVSLVEWVRTIQTMLEKSFIQASYCLFFYKCSFYYPNVKLYW